MYYKRGCTKASLHLFDKCARAINLISVSNFVHTVNSLSHFFYFSAWIL